MFYTLGQAAIAAGIGKSTLSKAIKNGKVSASKQANGSYLIDSAELHRVYRKPVSEPVHRERLETHVSTSQLDAMREERERERRQMQETIDDLRQRLNAATEAREQAADDVRRLTLLLSHDREEPPAKKKRFKIFG